MAPYIVVVSVFFIGIPHGAIDHIISAELNSSVNKKNGTLYFYSSYILIMIFIGLLWLITPVVGMALFLMISIYHFGQADMEDHLLDGNKNHLAYVLRGMLIIGLIIFSDLSVTLPIIAQATGTELIEFGFLTESYIALYIGIVSLYIAYSLLLTLIKQIRKPLAYWSDLVLLILLFQICGPLTGFALYFAVWHSAGHIYQMQRFFAHKDKELSILTFFRLALPFTLVSIGGLLILLFINDITGLADKFLTLMFILISVLTLPHMLIVDKLYSFNI